MPYALSFRKPLAIVDREQYINDCCVGGDQVLDRLLPALQAKYGELRSNQEDWGWFAWFEHASGVKLAVDVFTHDDASGEFQIHLTSRRPRLLLPDKVVDTPELEDLRTMVEQELQRWSVTQLRVERVDEKYMPTES